MSNPQLDAGLGAELAAIAESIGCELLAIERQGGILRVFLDREDGGVTLEHCQTVSRELSALLDAHDFGSGRYILEVSSPGLDRKLYKPADYRRFQGHLAKITFFEGPERKKKTIVGRLGELREDGGERISVEPQPKGEPFDIPLDDISVARLEVEL
jgi:ribosome maturation factor RimP